jgi:hypothetical protein
MKRILFVIIAAMLVATCGPAVRKADDNAAFDKFVADFLQGYFEQNPDFAVYQGATSSTASCRTGAKRA